MYRAVPISTAASGLDSGLQAVVFAAELVSQGAAMLCCPSCCADWARSHSSRRPDARGVPIVAGAILQTYEALITILDPEP